MADPFIHGHGPRPLGAGGDHGGDDGLYPLVGDMGEHATSAPGPIDLSSPCTRGQAASSMASMRAVDRPNTSPEHGMVTGQGLAHGGTVHKALRM